MQTFLLLFNMSMNVKKRNKIQVLISESKPS